MLEAYLAFARGDAGESAANIDMRGFLEELRLDAERAAFDAKVDVSRAIRWSPCGPMRSSAALPISLAMRKATRTGFPSRRSRDQRFLTIHVDDDGPGIPPGRREDVFRPFFRLDDARNQDEGGTGLGLAIALDIARSHGGDITLGDSAGGLRATVRVPV